MESVRCRPTHIAEDALQRRHMWLSRIMHVETHLMYDEGDVGPCQCQELEHARQTAVSRRVVSGRAVSGELVRGIDWRWSRFTIRHSCTF
jgi:hypothetical protein